MRNAKFINYAKRNGSEAPACGTGRDIIRGMFAAISLDYFSTTGNSGRGTGCFAVNCKFRATISLEDCAGCELVNGQSTTQIYIYIYKYGPDLDIMGCRTDATLDCCLQAGQRRNANLSLGVK